MSSRACIFCFSIVFIGSSQAQESPSTQIEAGLSQEDLSGDRPDWKSRYLEASHRFGERNTLYGVLRETERFRLRDSSVLAGLYFPISESWTGLIEAGGSDTHRVLAESSVYGELHYRFGGGWGMHAGLRHSEFTATEVDILVLGIERYFGAWRAAYTLHSGRPEDGDWEEAHGVRLDRYYGSRNSSIGVAITTGREAENVGPPTGVVVTEVDNVSLVGRHWLVRSWALSYEAFVHEQGDLYRRRGLRLGLRYGF